MIIRMEMNKEKEERQKQKLKWGRGAREENVEEVEEEEMRREIFSTCYW